MSYQYQGKVARKDKRYAHVVDDIVVTCPPVSEYTDQSFAAESDINTIMARYQSTGEMPVLNQTHPQYLDVTEQDFQSHMNFILEAQELFDDLPSNIRDRFGNDPGAFLGFCSDENNYAEMARMGLLTDEATTRFNQPSNPPQTPTSAPLGDGNPPNL